MNPILSNGVCSMLTPSSVQRAILEVVSGMLCNKREEILQFVHTTLLYTLASDTHGEQCDQIEMNKQCKVCINKQVLEIVDTLSKNGFMKIDEAQCFISSGLGKATFASSLIPEVSSSVKSEIANARTNLVISTDLHLLFLCTNPESLVPVNWDHFYCLLTQLTPTHRKVAMLCDIDLDDEQLLMISQTQTKHKGPCVYIKHMRFYTALLLLDIISEKPMSKVIIRYN